MQPIGIYDENNKLVAMLHDVTYVRESRVLKQSLDEDRANLIILRNKIGNDFIQSQITGKTNGKINQLTSFEKLDTLVKGPIEFAIATSSVQLNTSRTVTVDNLINKPTLKVGQVYAITYTPNGQKIAIPVKTTQIKEHPEVLEELMSTLDAFLQGNITRKDLQETFSKYLYSAPSSEKLDTSGKSFKQSPDGKDRIYIDFDSLNVEGVVFGKAGFGAKFINPKTPANVLPQLRKALQEMLSESYINMSFDNIKNPNFAKQYLTSNVRFYTLPDGRITVFDNPVISIDTSFAGEVKPVEKTEEQPRVAPEIISDEVYNNFVDNNIVPDDILNSIASKIVNKSTLTTRETAIFSGKTSEINEIIRQQSQQPVSVADVVPVYHHTTVAPQNFNFGSFQRGKDQISQFGDGLNAATTTNSFFVQRYGNPIQGEVKDSEFVVIDANKSEKELYEELKSKGYKFNNPDTGSYIGNDPAKEYNGTEKANEQPAIISLFNDFQKSNPQVKGVKVINHIIAGENVDPFYVIYDAKSFYGPGSLSKTQIQPASVSDIEAKKVELETAIEKQKEDLKKLTMGTPVGGINGLNIGSKWNDGYNASVDDSQLANNFDPNIADNDGEGYAIVTRVYEYGEVKDGKMSKAPKIQITTFNNKADADAYIEKQKVKTEEYKSKLGTGKVIDRIKQELDALEGEVFPVVPSLEIEPTVEITLELEEDNKVEIETLESEKQELVKQKEVLEDEISQIEEELNQAEELKQTKSVDDVINENVTEVELEKIVEEENLSTTEEAKQKVKEEVIVQMNDKSNKKPKTFLQKVASRIKKILLNITIVATVMSNSSFSFLPSAKSLTYDNATIENLQSFDNVKLDQDSLNKLQDVEIITGFNKNSNEKYLIVDKNAGMAHLYQGDSLITTYEVGTGKVKGDVQTRTVVKNGKVYWEEGNKQTGAGIYKIKSKGKYKTSASYTLVNERGIEVPTALHETLSERKKLFADNNPENNRMSFGCVNFQAKSLHELDEEHSDFSSDSKVYILPDDPNNKFKIVDGKLVFTSDNKDVNKSIVKYEAQPITLKAEGVNETGKEFLQSLSDNKADVMALYPTISNDEYNQLTRIAYGIFGQETSYGTYGLVSGQIGRATDYAQVISNKLLDTKYNPSIGVTQIRYSNVRADIRDKFDIQSVSDLTNPDKAAIATIAHLLDVYVNEIPNDLKDKALQLLPLAYSNHSEFVKYIKTKDSTILNNQYVINVNKNGDNVEIYLGVNETTQETPSKTPTQETSLLSLGLVGLLRRKKDGESITDDEIKQEENNLNQRLQSLKDNLTTINNRLLAIEERLNQLGKKEFITKPTPEVKPVQSANGVEFDILDDESDLMPMVTESEKQIEKSLSLQDRVTNLILEGKITKFCK